MFVDLPLYYLLVPSLLLAWFYWRQPALALMMVLVLSPAYLLKSNIGPVPTTLLELFIYCLVVVEVIKNWRRAKEWLKSMLILKPVWLILVLWLIAAALALTFSPDWRLSLGVFKGWFIDPFLFLLLVVVNTKSPIDYWRLIIGLIGGISLVSAYGLMEFGLKTGLRADGLLNSFYDPANYVAMLIVPIIFLAMSLALLTKEKKWRWLQWFLVVINILALYQTKSYGGYLALLVGLLVYGWLYRRLADNRRRLVVVAIIFIILGGLLVLSQNKFKTLLSNDSRTSLSTRQQIWQASTILIAEKPILGWGLGNFQESYRARVKQIFPKPLEWQVVKAHNLYLNIWIEMGLLGLLVFIYWLFKIFVTLRQQLKSNDKPRRLLASGLICGFIAVIIHGLVDTPYFKNDLSLFFFTLVGLVLLLEYYKDWLLEIKYKD